MNRALLALLLSPAFAIGQDQTWSEASVAACYQRTATKSEVIEAVECLKLNPAAGIASIDRLKRESTKLVTADADVAAALADLERQKNSHLYVKYRSRDGTARLMVVESATIGTATPTLIYDLAPLNIKFTPTSASFGEGKVVALQEIRSFRYVKKTEYGGELTTSFSNNTQVVDSSHKSDYLLKHYGPGDKRFAVMKFYGTTYPNKSLNDHLDLDPSRLSGYVLTFLSQEEGEDYVAKFEELSAAKEKAKQDALIAAAEQRRIAAQKETIRKAPILAEMAQAPLGREDSCRRIGDIFSMGDPGEVDIECQFAGRINLSDLKDVGWLVVNKRQSNSGTVLEYYIRKAR